MLNRRGLNFLGFLACVGMMGFAIYAEKILHLEPCPLCMFQRVGVSALGFIFALAALHHPRGARGARVYAGLITLIAALPAVVAGRHIYVQSQPEGSIPSCGATLDYMLEVFPLLTVVKKVLSGGGECARIDWRFLGLTMPMCVLASVLMLVLLAWYAATRRVERRRY